MPKEITHWIAADRLSRRMEGTAFGPALAAEPACLRMGAVFHDVLFYLTGEAPEGLRRLAHILHGVHGEDVGGLLTAQAAFARRAGGSKALAWLAGLASHAALDARLHPLVFHLTGNLFSKAPEVASRGRQNHRALESLLDLWMTRRLAAGLAPAPGSGLAWSPAPGVADWSLHGIWTACAAPLEALCDVAFLAGTAGTDLAAVLAAWTRSLDTFVLIQNMARSRILAQAVHAVRGLLPAKAREVAALLYCPQFLDKEGLFDAPLAYRHPVTGEALRHEVLGLVDLAVGDAAAILEALAPAALRGEQARLPGPLPSLETGLPRVPGAAMSHFLDPPVMGW